MKDVQFSELVGLTITDIHGGIHDNALTFVTSAGRIFQMRHEQDCCENVTLEEVHGDFADLLGVPVVQASESTNSNDPRPSDYSDSFTWTFYTLATGKGSVTLRWLGESNGYYSEAVSFTELTEKGGE